MSIILNLYFTNEIMYYVPGAVQKNTVSNVSSNIIIGPIHSRVLTFWNLFLEECSSLSSTKSCSSQLSFPFMNLHQVKNWKQTMKSI